MIKFLSALPVVLLLAAGCNSSGSQPLTDQNIPAQQQTATPPGNIMAFRDLKVISPTGDDTWTRGSSHTITWKTTNLVSTAKIKITLSSISQITTNSGKYTLQIPTDLKAGGYYLKVTEIMADGSEGVGSSSHYIVIK